VETRFRVRAGSRQTRGPSTPQNRSRANDSAPLGMTVWVGARAPFESLPSLRASFRHRGRLAPRGIPSAQDDRVWDHSKSENALACRCSVGPQAQSVVLCIVGEDFGETSPVQHGIELRLNFVLGHVLL